MEKYNLFVELSLKMCKKDDYADKAKVKTHNLAFKKLFGLQNEMKMEPDGGIETLKMLLSHSDERVRLNAASMCFCNNILTQEAKSVLKKIIDTSLDSTIVFAAQVIIKNSSMI